MASTQTTYGYEQHAGDGTPSRTGANVNEVERWASLIGGGALAYYAIKRGDLAGFILALIGGELLYRGVTSHCPVYQMMGVSTAETGLSEQASIPAPRGIRVEKTITINRPAADLYNYWHNFENLPHFMEHLEAVQVTSDQHSHWVAKAPVGTKVEWEAEIINDQPNRMISWRSVGDSQVPNAGSVWFRELPEGRGTEVRVEIEYDPPAGALGATVAKLFGEEPSQQVEDDLRHFKQVMETGETPTTEGQSSGREAVTTH